MANQNNLIKQYADTGAIIPEYQLKKLSKNLIKTYIKRRLAQAQESHMYKIQGYEARFIPHETQIQLVKSEEPLSFGVYSEFPEDCRILYVMSKLKSGKHFHVSDKHVELLPKKYQLHYMKGGLYEIHPQALQKFGGDIQRYYYEERFKHQNYNINDIASAPKDLLNELVEKGDVLPFSFFRVLPDDLRDRYVYLRLHDSYPGNIQIDYLRYLGDEMKRYMFNKLDLKHDTSQYIFMQIPEDCKEIVIDTIIDSEDLELERWHLNVITDEQQKRILKNMVSKDGEDIHYFIKYFNEENQWAYYKWRIDSDIFSKRDLINLSAPSLKKALRYLTLIHNGDYKLSSYIYEYIEDDEAKTVFMDYIVDHSIKLEGGIFYGLQENGKLREYVIRKYTPLPKDLDDLHRNEINRLPDDKYVTTLKALSDIKHPILLDLLEEFTDWPSDEAYKDERRALLKKVMNYTEEPIHPHAFFRNEDLELEFFTDWLKKGKKISSYIMGKIDNKVKVELERLGLI
jgi:hypothetical protein